MAFLNFMTRQLLANRELCNLDARTFCNNLSALEIAQLEPRATVKCQIVAVLTSAAAAKTSRSCTIKRRPVSLNRHSNSSLDSTSTFGEYSNAIIIS